MRVTGAAFALAIADRSRDEVRERHHAAMTFDAGEVERDAAGAPTAFLMWKPGLNATDHGDHYFTEESAAIILADQQDRGNLFSIDVDHLSLNDQAPPESHKAVGWFRVDVRAGALWAVDVKWTDSVRAGFGKDVPEWRYFSPAYETKKKSGEIVRLMNCALTNNPATHRVTALATTATKKGAVMADEEKKEESLGAMLAAFEAEGDEEKRCAMKEAIRAKFKAAFPDDGDDKKDEKKETKAAEEPSDKKEEKKASADADDDEKKKESIAASIAAKAISKFEKARADREEKAEVERILAKLPEGDRKTYEGLALEPLKRVVARHHSEVLTHFAAAGQVSPTRGETQSERASMLPAAERAELDRKMGFVRPAPFVEEHETMLVFNPHATPADADKFLASLSTERSKAQNDGEALSRVFANQKGSAR